MRITVPSERNFEIFHELVEDGHSLTDVGNRWHLSRARVAEIRDQVRRWRKLVAPDWEEDRYRRQDSVTLCRIHQDRTGRCYELMMESFRISRGMQTVAQTAAADVHMTTTYNSPGDPKYVLAAIRCSREQMQTGLVIAKLPDEYFARPQDVEAVEMNVPELEQELHEMDEHEKWEERARQKTEARVRHLEALAASRSVPPESVLTDLGEEVPEPTRAPAEVKVATRADDEASDVADILRQQQRHDRRKKLSPIHPGKDNEEKRRELAAQLFGAAG
jgi:hypothetical protein